MSGPDSAGKYIDIANKDQIQQRTTEMRNHQLQRISYFLTLPVNLQKKQRMECLRNYRKELLNLQDLENLEQLKKIAVKGDKIEMWQDFLCDLAIT